MDETTQTRVQDAASEPRKSSERGAGATIPPDAKRDVNDKQGAKDTKDIEGTRFAGDGGFEARWREIKAGFVDDPRQSIEQADALVNEALTRITTRQRALSDQWKSSGDESDTERLRLALHDYHTLLLQLTGK